MVSPNPIQTWRVCPLWQRLAARIIDTSLVVPMAPLMIDVLDRTFQSRNIFAVAAVSIGLAALELFFVTVFQGTPGKRILGMRILRQDGKAPTPMDAFQRQALFIALVLLDLLHMGAALPQLPEGTTVENMYTAIQEIDTSWLLPDRIVTGIAMSAVLLVALRPDRRGLHDIWAETVVVRRV